MEKDVGIANVPVADQSAAELCDYVALTNEPIDVLQAYNFVVDPVTGASSIFVGTTRDSFGNRTVLKLSYEAYEPMALKEMKQLCANVRSTSFKLHKIYMLHRLGEVPTKEASIVIAVSSVHRADSLGAVQLLIDSFKERVPIWKKEIYEDGGSEWKENKECYWKNN